jgi:antitoxin (DNA-binding transcriptional repressor) of toxin-antitoxin stability system
MKTMSVGEFKTHFSEALKCAESGEKIAITFGKKKEIKAYLVPKEIETKPRKLGILEGKSKVVFHNDFKMSVEEFLGL